MPLEQRPLPGPDANALELFARVVAAGSFAHAARQLGLTRAAISRRIAVIERSVGVPLFARTTRALGLTEAGRRLASRARLVLDAAEQARRGLRSDARQGLSGTLRITSAATFSDAVLAPLLVRFLALHPGLRIDLRVGPRRMDLLRDEVDVAFRLTAQPPPDSVAQPVLRYAVRAYAAPGAGLPLASPAALAQQRCLIFDAPRDALTLTWQCEANGGRVEVPIDPAWIGDDLTTLMAAARAGGGIVLAPDFAVGDALAAGQLVDALPGWHLLLPLGATVQALTLPLAVAPESARALVRFVREALADRLPGAADPAAA